LIGVDIHGDLDCAGANLQFTPDEITRQLGDEDLAQLRLLRGSNEWEETQATFDRDKDETSQTQAPSEHPPAKSGHTNQLEGSNSNPPAADTQAGGDVAGTNVGEIVRKDQMRLVLDAQGIRVGGQVFLNNRFTAGGGVNLLGGDLGLDLRCNDATLVNKYGPALIAQATRFSGNAGFSYGTVVMGEVNLFGADIGGTLVCWGAKLINEGGPAINGHTIKVRGDVLLSSDRRDNSAVMVGEVNLSNADIGGDLDCSTANFDNPEGVALSIQGAQVQGEFLWGPFGIKPSSSTDFWMFADFGSLTGDPPTGVVDFTRARVGRLTDHWSAWEGKPDLRLDGFDFEMLGEGAADVSWRLAWLDQQARQRPDVDQQTREALDKAIANLPEVHEVGNYSPHPFEHLAIVYERMGYDAVARKVRIAKQRALRISGRASRSVWISNILLDWTIRYGWEPWRAVTFGLLVVIFGALIFGSAGEASFVPDSDLTKAASFNPLAYSFDTFVPLINLGQESRWAPGNVIEWSPFGWKTSGLPLQIYLWIHIIMGWIASTMAAVAFTGLVRKS
jgi:hypothetical protein